MHRLRQRLCRGLLAAALVLPLGTAAATGPQRWDLTDLYPTSDAWESAYRQAEARAKADGHVTRVELRQLTAMLDQADAQIRQARHDRDGHRPV